MPILDLENVICHGIAVKIIDAFLASWKQNPLRKPLIINGARQIGKAVSIRAFGQANDESVIEINSVLQKKFRSLRQLLLDYKEDITQYAKITIAATQKLKKLKYYLSNSVPVTINFSNIARYLELDRDELPDTGKESFILRRSFPVRVRGRLC